MKRYLDLMNRGSLILLTRYFLSISFLIPLSSPTFPPSLSYPTFPWKNQTDDGNSNIKRLWSYLTHPFWSEPFFFRKHLLAPFQLRLHPLFPSVIWAMYSFPHWNTNQFKVTKKSSSMPGLWISHFLRFQWRYQHICQDWSWLHKASHEQREPEIFWVKPSSKAIMIFICCIYRSPKNTLISKFRFTEIVVLGDLIVHNKDSLGDTKTDCQVKPAESLVIVSTLINLVMRLTYHFKSFSMTQIFQIFFLQLIRSLIRFPSPLLLSFQIMDSTLSLVP